MEGGTVLKKTVMFIGIGLALTACQSLVSVNSKYTSVIQQQHITQWQCGHEHIEAVFDDKSNKVKLNSEEHSITLSPAVAASGARYVDQRGNEFWNKGDQAVLTLHNSKPQQCQRIEEISPWEKARRRGVVFRAIGDEPGWSVEIGQGDAPKMDILLDYGESQLQVLSVKINSGRSLFTGKDSHGTTVSLRLQQTGCQDTMSGEYFPTRAVLSVNGKRYRGCGRFL